MNAGKNTVHDPLYLTDEGERLVTELQEVVRQEEAPHGEKEEFATGTSWWPAYDFRQTMRDALESFQPVISGDRHRADLMRSICKEAKNYLDQLRGSYERKIQKLLQQDLQPLATVVYERRTEVHRMRDGLAILEAMDQVLTETLEPGQIDHFENEHPSCLPGADSLCTLDDREMKGRTTSWMDKPWKELPPPELDPYTTT